MLLCGFLEVKFSKPRKKMDKIKIYGLSFFAYHGVFEEEKITGQEFIVDCEFEIDTSLCNDELEKTVNYGQCSMDIVKFCTTNRFDLLETLADCLAKYMLKKYSLMNSVTITVHKPNAPIPLKFADVTLTTTRKWNDCFLALGSNLGDREAHLNSVLKLIDSDDNIELLKKSSYIQTKPYGVLDQPEFLNAVIKVKTLYTPNELLAFCQQAEKLAQRVQTRRWGERTLDVDILTFCDSIIFTDELKIPHPEMHIRDFVLKPLSEIEPYLIHPVYKINIQNLLQQLT